MYGLSAHNALDYFAQSDFYDKSCNNEHIKMQHQPLEALLKMTGLEYALLKTGHEPHLFVVVKQRRDSAALAARLGIYVRGGLAFAADTHPRRSAPNPCAVHSGQDHLPGAQRARGVRVADPQGRGPPVPGV
jgi:hypothetical protein